MGGGRRSGPTCTNPFSRFTSPRTPGPLGYNDAGDPRMLTTRGDTPGCLGLNDEAGLDIQRVVDPMDFDYLVSHHESKSHLVESTLLRDTHLIGWDKKHKTDLWKDVSIWKIGGAIVFRISNLSEDLDGSPRAYHPPTDASWSGHGHGLGKDSLANAVGIPGVTKYAHSKKESDWALTAGCQLFRDLHKAAGLEAKAGAAPPAVVPPPGADKTKDELDKIYKTHGVKNLSELQTKSKSAVCVLYIDGRPKKDSQDDWSHVVKWAGIQTDSSGKPTIRDSGPNKGFYIPSIVPSWADAEKHPWVVLNPPQDQFGVKLTNPAVVIKNGETPSIAYGMVADRGPVGHVGEVSRKMIDDLGYAAASPKGDYIVVQFPQDVSTATIGKEKELSAIRDDAKSAFEAWTFEGRSGMDLVKELFPTPEQYHRVQRDFGKSKQYLTGYVDHLMLKL